MKLKGKWRDNNYPRATPIILFGAKNIIVINIPIMKIHYPQAIFLNSQDNNQDSSQDNNQDKIMT